MVMTNKDEPFLDAGNKAYAAVDDAINGWLDVVGREYGDASGYEIFFALEIALLRHAVRIHLFEGRAMTQRNASEAGFQELAVTIFRDMKC
jgi:predicted Zn-dependent protease with MMP-like domain